ncbi:hypothetical protein LWI28_020793 [Acer negundo]|uniref:VQ domain-containing protein n=1 Tax=Acer negundo TaxID=4023 RepID=A0AAD5IJZ3_ACENE|nr:hypothetical protein LWI28_020793 [Acer negundo]KAK4842819.1 hypothetical protein QYF36_000512 [Acer negundo]
MEAYSSSSSSYLFENSHSQAAAEGLKEAKLFQSSLRSVRKSPTKPWKKPAIAPLPPTRPRVYKVDPVNFRDLVQKLTGAPEFLQQPQRLRSVAPPPLSIGATPSSFTSASPAATTPFSALYKELMMSELTPDTKPTQKMMMSDWSMMSNSIGLGLSPASHNWCTSLLSPGALSSQGQI